MTEKTNGEVDRTIPVSAEDCDNVRNYSLHFGVEISPALTDAMANFEKDTSSYEFMLDFKRELCAWLTTCGHESFQDSLWEHPTGAAADILFDLQFDRDVQDILLDTSREDTCNPTADDAKIMLESIKKNKEKVEKED